MTTLEQHYYHISNGGITASVERNDVNYSLQFAVNSFGIGGRTEIDLATPDMVDSLIGMLQRVRAEMNAVPPGENAMSWADGPTPYVMRGLKVTQRWEDTSPSTSELVAYELVDDQGYVVETIRPDKLIERGCCSSAA